MSLRRCSSSGHRGSSLCGSFNEAHILAITQATCDYRRSLATDGPLHVGKDTQTLSGPGTYTYASIDRSCRSASGLHSATKRASSAI
jgi:phosphoglucomutase